MGLAVKSDKRPISPLNPSYKRGMCGGSPSPTGAAGAAGFTLIEVLIALAIIAVALTAIGSLMAATVRGTHAIDRHLSLVETARAVEAALPDRAALAVGDLSGSIGGNRWRVDVAPLISNLVDPCRAARDSTWCRNRLCLVLLESDLRTD